MGGKAVTELSFKQCMMVFIVVLKLRDYADNILHGRQEGSKHNYSKIKYYYKLSTKVVMRIYPCQFFFFLINIQNLHRCFHSFQLIDDRKFGVCTWLWEPPFEKIPVFPYRWEIFLVQFTIICSYIALPSLIQKKGIYQAFSFVNSSKTFGCWNRNWPWSQSLDWQKHLLVDEAIFKSLIEDWGFCYSALPHSSQQ